MRKTWLNEATKCRRQLRQIKFTMRTSKALNKNINRKDKDTPMEA